MLFLFDYFTVSLKVCEWLRLFEFPVIVII